MVQCLGATSPVDVNKTYCIKTSSVKDQQEHRPSTSSGDRVLLRSLLRYGTISYCLGDLQIWDPQFLVPEYITRSLSQRYCTTPVTGVIIVRDHKGRVQWSTDSKYVEFSRSRNKGIQIALNETLMLKTRIRYGLVSFQESDIHFMHGNLKIPQPVIDRLEEEYCFTPCGILYIISDQKGNLRYAVKLTTISRWLTLLN